MWHESKLSQLNLSYSNPQVIRRLLIAEVIAENCISLLPSSFFLLPSSFFLLLYLLTELIEAFDKLNHRI